MKYLLIEISILLSLVLAASCESDKTQSNSDDKSQYAIYPNVIDTTFLYENQKYQLTIKTREDLLHRKISDRCEALVTEYGNEFILQFFEINNDQSSLLTTNFINYELIKKLDRNRKLDVKQEILASHINFIGIKENMCVLSVSTYWPFGEGGNDIELGFNIKHINETSFFCPLRGIFLLDITSPWDY